jgi:hypothetical protein
MCELFFFGERRGVSWGRLFGFGGLARDENNGDVGHHRFFLLQLRE